MSMQQQKGRRKTSGWARLLGAFCLGAALGALSFTFIRAFELGGLSPEGRIVAGVLAGLVGAFLGALLIKTPAMALRAFLCSAAALGLLYAFYRFIIEPGLEVIPFTYQGEDIEIQAPVWLGLICLVPYFWLIDGATLADFHWSQRALSALWRSLIVVALALSLTKAHVVATEQKICTVVLIDVSDSVPDEAIERAREFLVQTIESSREKDTVRAVVFASRPRVLDIPAEILTLRGEELRQKLPAIERPPKSEKKDQEQEEGAGTDIQSALRLAYGLYPPGYLKRAVILSDGNQTAGDLLAEAYEASALGIKLYARAFPEVYPEEVLIKSVSVPERVQQGAPFDLRVEVFSSKPQKARMRMCKDGFCDPTDVKSLDLPAGITEVVFERQQINTGSFAKFTFDLTPQGEDTLADNNHSTEAVIVRSKPHVLYLEGERSQASYFREALAAQDIDVEVRGPHEVPTSLSELEAFDLVVMSDVDATFVNATQMDLIERYVRDLGGGFLMTGGERSFGLGGYFRTPLEKILPVDFDTDKDRDTPSVAISLVIDKSGSMAGPKIQIAKEAAKAVVDLLAPSDYISVIGFDGAAVPIVDIQPARNRIKILSDIARLEAGGGTAIFPALDKAYEELKSVRAKLKHVILLSDGQAPTDGLISLAQLMHQDRITISTVGVGDGADRDLLEQMADVGGGRSYFTREASNIPKIFTKEATTATRSAVVEGAYAVVPTAAGARAQMLKGIDWNIAPEIWGYVATKPKRGAEILLVSDTGEPLLAKMSVGLGKTAIWASDVKARWSTPWIRWSGYGTFWAQVVRDLMRHRVQERFELRAEPQGDVFRAIVDAVDEEEVFVNGMQSELVIFDPEKPRDKRSFPLYQTAAGRYEGEFRLPGFGSYVIEALHKKDGQVLGQSRATVSQPYPREHLSFDQDAVLLAKAASLTGGTDEAEPAVLFDPGTESVKSFSPLWPYFVLAALALFLVDVFLRRVRFGRF